MAEVLPEHLDGTKLYGNDLRGPDLQRWYDEEEHGFADLATGQYANAEGEFEIGTKAFNRWHGSLLPAQRFETCLAIGCANGEDVLSLELDIGRIIAIEPSRHWWKDHIGHVPAEYRAPTLEGDLELPDGSVDLAVAFGALHHVATVERVVSEMGRVLRPGGWMLIREPMNSMGDFRRMRPGLTRNERGIPRQLMLDFIRVPGWNWSRPGHAPSRRSTRSCRPWVGERRMIPPSWFASTLWPASLHCSMRAIGVRG